MKQPPRTNYVVIADEQLRKAYDELPAGRHEDRQLRACLDEAFDDLKNDPFIGIKIPKSLWPKEYRRKYAIENLRKIDLPNGWRLIYFIKGTEVDILAIVLEWYSHKEYEKRFGYNVGLQINKKRKEITA